MTNEEAREKWYKVYCEDNLKKWEEELEYLTSLFGFTIKKYSEIYAEIKPYLHLFKDDIAKEEVVEWWKWFYGGLIENKNIKINYEE